ncbi:MAG: OPT family oligopeptide transporter [Opitutaceae bacterium]|nr:OPT family oligopeptide transporter [Opitutaceae bacterium]
MALQHLTDEQTRTWTRAQKDRWWFENIYRGDLPQLTIRSAIAGFFLGGILSATALYIGGKTGITIGVGLTSVILAFAIFKSLHSARLGPDFTILENNCTQSIATAAGYMITPLVSSMAAYMLVTTRIIPWWQMLVWNAIISILGVLVAFPLKRRFINEEQMPFPEGRACGVVLDTLYSGHAGAGMIRARVLAVTAGLAGGLQFLMSDGLQRLLQFKLLRLDRWAGMAEPWHLRERLDDYYYLAAAKAHWWIPKILGTDVRTLGLRVGLDAAMLGVGGLMGIRVSSSVLLGTLVNFVILAPWMIQRGDIAPRLSAAGQLIPLNRAEIVNQWSLWWGVAMMVVGSLVSLLAKPEIFRTAWNMVFGRKKETAAAGDDPLQDIELPLWVSGIGVPIFGAAAVYFTHSFFGVPWHLALFALPLIFVLTIICTNSMALTSWTPTGALSKITQFTIGAIDRTNPATNLMTGGMTAELASNAANLLSDIKPGYMLGAKPRQQAIGHVIGIFAGALASTPLFFLLFLPSGADGARTTASIVTDQFPMPGAMQWKGVSDLISGGLKNLPASAIVAMAIAAAFAFAFEIARMVTRGKFPLSPVGIGLGVVLPPDACLLMFLGAFGFWILGRRHPEPGTRGNLLWVECCEPICAGLISGAALIGILNAIVNAVLG